MNTEVKRYGHDKGIGFADGKAFLTFSILGAKGVSELIDTDMANNVTVVGDHFNMKGFTIASHGKDNQLPTEVKTLIKANSTLPEILKKQVRMMYGQGLSLYVVDEEADPTKRKWVAKDYYDVLNWLDSWDKDPELDSAANYAKQAIQDYYYLEGFYNQWFFNKSRRINGSMPIRGLKFLSSAKCRLAKNGTIEPHRLMKDEDCDSVLYTDWRLRNFLDIDSFPRFNTSNPLKYATAVNYVRDRGFDELIYSEPTFFAGLKEWIIGENLSPKYINSYLKDSLSAKLHIIIPHAWIERNEKTLREICERNQESDKLTKKYAGVDLVDSNGKALLFSYDLLEELINKKIADVTAVLSGAGENQGKAFWSRSFRTADGLEEWEFKEIPVKYAEFIKSLLDYDVAAVKRILAGKGIDPAISNIGNEGVFNSGAQVYYSYLVYLDTLGFAEEFILEDLNRALWINFPKCQTARVKLGFKRFAPPRQQETTPNDRMDANGNQSTTKKV